MNASLLLDDPVSHQLQALTILVWQLRNEVGQLRSKNAQLRRQIRELKCDVGYWKSRHSDAVGRRDAGLLHRLAMLLVQLDLTVVHKVSGRVPRPSRDRAKIASLTFAG